MKKRLLTSLFLAVLYLGLIIPAILVHPIFFDVLVVVFMITTAYEMIKVIGAKFDKPIAPVVYVAIGLSYAVFKASSYFFKLNESVVFAFLVILLMIFVAFIVSMCSQTIKVSNVLSTIFVLIYPFSFLILLLSVNYINDIFRVAGIIYCFGVTSLVDSMALFVGITFKGKKLCPTISPNKTVSGAIGGLLGGVLGGTVIFILAYYNLLGMVAYYSSIWQNLLLYIGVGIGVSVCCQFGDLIASHVKRYCEVKDYSNALPGHGGFMDRIDGVLMASLFIYVFFNIFRLF